MFVAELGAIVFKNLAPQRLRFLHDRMQQAAYGMLDDQAKREAHLRIGLLLQSSVADVVDAIIDDFLWFVKWKERYPTKFFYYFGHTFDREMLFQLADFLNIEPDKRWCDISLEIFEVQNMSYGYTEDLLEHYDNAVKSRFRDYPRFCRNLLRFTEDCSPSRQ